MQQQDLNAASFRLIIVAMIIGILMLAGVSIAVGPLVEDDPGLTQLMQIAPLALGLIELPVYFVVRGAIVAASRRRHPQPLTSEEAVRLFTPIVLKVGLVAAAMAEGVALFALVAFLLTGVWWILALPALAVLALALLFPTDHKLEEAAKSAADQEHA